MEQGELAPTHGTSTISIPVLMHRFIIISPVCIYTLCAYTKYCVNSPNAVASCVLFAFSVAICDGKR